MTAKPPLPALLSHAWVAFAIEFDNEFERRAPHRTTRYGPRGRELPWLVSMVVWQRFLRHVPDAGITARELRRLSGCTPAATRQWLLRLSQWWGYLRLAPAPQPGDWLVRPSPGGRAAMAVWRPLTEEIEARWQQRHGAAMDTLRASLRGLAGDPALPGYLPIQGHGLFCDTPEPGSAPAEDTLPAELANALLAYALEFERKSDISLSICANLLRPAAAGRVKMAELPRLSGVSKEAIAMAVAWASKGGLIEVKGRQLSLTATGTAASRRHRRLEAAITEGWMTRHGPAAAGLQHALEAAWPRLAEGLAPPAGSWRARLPAPATLPHFPAVLHRGAFPDGS